MKATTGENAWIKNLPPYVAEELLNRADEISRLEKEQLQLGTSVPNLYGSVSKFIANPSTVSVETYKRMLDTDETVGSGVDFLILAMIARFGDYKHPVPEITKFVRQVLGAMDGSWHENLAEMLSAEWAGFSCTEQVWDFKRDFMGQPAYVPTKLVTYPPLTIVFAVDRNGEVLPDGIYQYQRYHNTFFNAYVYGVRQAELDGFRPDLYASAGDYPYPIRIAADLSYLTVKIEKTKIIHLRSSVTGGFRNPYGRSLFRRAYKHWVMKDAFLKMWIIAADRKGTPLVVGFAAPNDTVLSKDNSELGQGQVKEMRSDLAMADAFSKMHNSSFLVFPGKKGETYDIESVSVQGDMNVFKDGVDSANKSIMRALLIPPLAFSSGDGTGSYALAQEHNKILKQVIDGKLKPYHQSILDQFIRKVIGYNFPKKVWEKHGFGEFALEEYDPEVMEKLANIFGQLTDRGFMSPEAQTDMDFVRQKIGAPKGVAMQKINEMPDLAGQDIPPGLSI